MKQHTPTPWRTMGDDNDGVPYIEICAGEIGKGYYQIAHVQSQLIDETDEFELTPTDRANAAYIVECVNAHAGLKALVGELERALINSNIEIQAIIATTKLSDLNFEMLHLRIQANEAILMKARAV